MEVEHKIYKFKCFENDSEEYKGVLELVPVFDVNGFKKFRPYLENKQVNINDEGFMELINFYYDEEDLVYGVNPINERMEITEWHTPYEATRIYMNNTLMIIKRNGEAD